MIRKLENNSEYKKKNFNTNWIKLKKNFWIKKILFLKTRFKMKLKKKSDS